MCVKSGRDTASSSSSSSCSTKKTINYTAIVEAVYHWLFRLSVRLGANFFTLFYCEHRLGCNRDFKLYSGEEHCVRERTQEECALESITRPACKDAHTIFRRVHKWFQLKSHPFIYSWPEVRASLGRQPSAVLIASFLSSLLSLSPFFSPPLLQSITAASPSASSCTIKHLCIDFCLLDCKFIDATRSKYPVTVGSVFTKMLLQDAFLCSAHICIAFTLPRPLTLCLWPKHFALVACILQFHRSLQRS